MKTAIMVIAALSLAIPATALADPGKGKGKGPQGGRPAAAGHHWTPPGLARKPHGMPPGQAKKIWGKGENLPQVYVTQPRYYVTQPSRYGLGPTPYGYRWVRVGDNYYLAQTQTGVISQIISALIH